MVTGSSGGIGRAIAEAFAAEGAAVVVNSRDRARADAVVVALTASGHKAMAFPADIRDPVRVKAMAAAAAERFGRLDIWVNDAGVNVIRPAAELSVGGLEARHRHQSERLLLRLTGRRAHHARSEERRHHPDRLGFRRGRPAHPHPLYDGQAWAGGDDESAGRRVGTGKRQGGLPGARLHPCRAGSARPGAGPVHSTFATVVLPDPLGPIRATRRPGSRRRSTPARADGPSGR